MTQPIVGTGIDPSLPEDVRSRLLKDLVKLGDMMGDGSHHEPDGKWIEKEYHNTLKALGLIPKTKRRNNSVEINEKMALRVKSVKCPNCKSDLKQTRSGSMKAKCTSCNSLYTLLKRAEGKNHAS